MLNPANDPKLDHHNVITWVKERRPKRLIVTIGHNQGVWDVGFLGNDRDIQIGDIKNLKKLADDMADAEVDTVIWDLLPKISAVASLEIPPRPSWIPKDPNTGREYAKEYRPVFSFSKTPLKGARLKQIDDSIEKTNEAMRKRVTKSFGAGSNRIVFFDDFKMFESIDYKNIKNRSSKRARERRICFKRKFGAGTTDQCIDNRVIYADYRDAPKPTGMPPRTPYKKKKVVAGGFQSLDGMHPSGAGYAHKAELISQMPELGLKPARPRQLVKPAFGRDKLTADFPTVFNTLRLAIKLFRKLAGKKKVNAKDKKEKSTAESNIQCLSTSHGR